VFQIGVGVALGEMVVMRDAPVLNDAVQLQAELDRAERQTAAFLFQRVGDDVFDLDGGIVEQSLMGALAVGAELLDPDADFRLAHQESAALLRALRRVAGPAGGFRAAVVAGHGLTESLLPVGQADDGRG
jgi:hypothetical protein